MNKIIGIIFLVALLFPVFAHAGPCGDFEYAELQDMDQESFLVEYCKVRKTGKLAAELSIYTNSRQAKSDFDSCYAMMTKMERIFMKRFKIEDREEMVAKCK